MNPSVYSHSHSPQNLIRQHPHQQVHPKHKCVSLPYQTHIKRMRYHYLSSGIQQLTVLIEKLSLDSSKQFSRTTIVQTDKCKKKEIEKERKRLSKKKVKMQLYIIVIYHCFPLLCATTTSTILTKRIKVSARQEWLKITISQSSKGDMRPLI